LYVIRTHGGAVGMDACLLSEFDLGFLLCFT